MKDKIHNDKIRKTTSLIIMTIMVAGGLTFAIPGTPVAHAATENLFVSAENSLFDNSFAGPMVIEIVVNDPDLKDVDSLESEPDVTVNGQDIQMVQATDGNWYAYFAERTMAFNADGMVPAGSEGESLDFGVLCPASVNDGTGTGTSYSDTDGVYFQHGDCTSTADTWAPDTTDPIDDLQNVLREQKCLCVLAKLATTLHDLCTTMRLKVTKHGKIRSVTRKKHTVSQNHAQKYSASGALRYVIRIRA